MVYFRLVRHAPEALLDLQTLILDLQRYWADCGCIIQQSYDVEVGAGTMHPETFLRVLGPEPYRVAYVQPSRRPADARYGENPFRLGRHLQLQVVLKPSPDDVQDLAEGIAVVVAEPAGAAFEDVNGRENPLLGQLAIEHDLAVARPFELLKDELVHL